MITVDKFLCFKLETGGLVIGWLTLIGSILGAISCSVYVIMFGNINCDDSREMKNDLFDDPKKCSKIRGIIIGVLVFCIVLCILCAYFGWRCIQGTKAHNHFRVKPLMILLAIAAVSSILEILTFNAFFIVSGIIGAIVNGYYFLVLYSLYSVFRMEYETNANRHQYQQPGKV